MESSSLKNKTLLERRILGWILNFQVTQSSGRIPVQPQLSHGWNPFLGFCSARFCKFAIFLHEDPLRFRTNKLREGGRGKWSLFGLGVNLPRCLKKKPSLGHSMNYTHMLIKPVITIDKHRLGCSKGGVEKQSRAWNKQFESHGRGVGSYGLFMPCGLQVHRSYRES